MGEVGAVKELQVPKEVGRLTSLCDSLNDSLLKLMDRTKSIRLDRPQNPSGVEGKPLSNRVLLAEELASVASRIEAHIMRLDEITNSLEI